jgi:hypothetical protein
MNMAAEPLLATPSKDARQFDSSVTSLQPTEAEPVEIELGASLNHAAPPAFDGEATPPTPRPYGLRR